MMSRRKGKAEAARVRGDVLQSLYVGMLRCEMAQGGARTGVSPAVAAGLSQNLRGDDLLLLPQGRSGDAFPVPRGLGPPGGASVSRSLLAGIQRYPGDEPAGVALALGAAAAARQGGGGALVCVLLPRAATLEHAGPGRARTRRFPATWSSAGLYAAQLRLPLLLLSDRPAAPPNSRRSPGIAAPAPLYPTIAVDRDDALAVYRVAFECAARARAGDGPSALECVPFRPQGVPAKAESGLVRLETMLRQQALFTARWLERAERQLVKEVAGA